MVNIEVLGDLATVQPGAQVTQQQQQQHQHLHQHKHQQKDSGSLPPFHPGVAQSMQQPSSAHHFTPEVDVSPSCAKAAVAPRKRLYSSSLSSDGRDLGLEATACLTAQDVGLDARGSLSGLLSGQGKGRKEEAGACSGSRRMAPVPECHGWERGVIDKVNSSRSLTPAQKEQMAAKILEFMGPAVYVFDTQGNVNFWTAPAQRMFEYEEGEALGHNICRLVVPKETVPFADHVVRDYLVKGSSWSGQLPGRTKDGKVSQTVFINTPMLDDNGGLWGIVGVAFPTQGIFQSLPPMFGSGAPEEHQQQDEEDAQWHLSHQHEGAQQQKHRQQPWQLGQQGQSGGSAHTKKLEPAYRWPSSGSTQPRAAKAPRCSSRPPAALLAASPGAEADCTSAAYPSGRRNAGTNSHGVPPLCTGNSSQAAAASAAGTATTTAYPGGRSVGGSFPGTPPLCRGNSTDLPFALGAFPGLAPGSPSESDEDQQPKQGGSSHTQLRELAGAHWEGPAPQRYTRCQGRVGEGAGVGEGEGEGKGMAHRGYARHLSRLSQSSSEEWPGLCAWAGAPGSEGGTSEQSGVPWVERGKSVKQEMGMGLGMEGQGLGPSWCLTSTAGPECGWEVCSAELAARQQAHHGKERLFGLHSGTPRTPPLPVANDTLCPLGARSTSSAGSEALAGPGHVTSGVVRRPGQGGSLLKLCTGAGSGLIAQGSGIPEASPPLARERCGETGEQTGDEKVVENQGSKSRWEDEMLVVGMPLGTPDQEGSLADVLGVPFAATVRCPTQGSRGGAPAVSEASERLEHRDMRWRIEWDEISLGVRLGEGLSGSVYKASWKGADVAVKVFSPTHLSRGQEEEFRREVGIMESLRHPNIVLYLGAVESPLRRCIVSEFMPRGSLFRVLQRASAHPLSLLRRLRMALGAARGVYYLHNCSPPIVHHDLKSANLLVDRDWTVKVADFGLSKFKYSAEMSAKSSRGTPQWMAPEVLRTESSGEKSDVYSFGVILWELVTRQVPWDGLNPMQVVGAVGFMDQRLSIPCAVSPDMRDLIKSCWHRDPALRPDFKGIIDTLQGMVCREERRRVGAHAEE